MAAKDGKAGRLTAVMALRLAAPHTWAASALPVVFAAALSVKRGADINIPLLLSMAAASVLMQSAVNTFNDYSDFLKGTDTAENSPDASDAVMVYDNPKPEKVLLLGAVYLLAAAVCGIPAILSAGIRPLLIGLLGGVFVLIYSFGKRPVSYLPLGELVSGICMGALIPYAVCGTLTGSFDWQIFLYSLPLVLGIALIMMTNNGCDILRDTAAGRRTFAVLAGERKTAAFYRGVAALWLLLPLALVSIRGACVYAVALLSFSGSIFTQLRLSLSPENRGKAMAGIVSLNSMAALAYSAALLLP